MNYVILGNERDNVVTCCKQLPVSAAVTAGGRTALAKSEIPIYHKMALCDIKKGEEVYKYGSPIGVASADIAAGEHVHTHNLESARGRGDKREGEQA